MIGSATTLVLNKFEKELLTPDIVKLACAPLLLDSYNFSPNLKDSKWVDLDLKVFENLQSNTDEDLREHWNWLSQIKQEIKSNLELGCESLLIKDYKNY